MASHFRDAKRVILHKLSAGTDFSPKGSIDAPVAHLVHFINTLPPFVTLSSCSGRIAIYAHGPGVVDGSAGAGDDTDGGSTKGAGRWLFVTHGPGGIAATDLVAALAECDAWPGSSAILKVEPLILHVQVADVPAARLLLTAALDSGFRESGITMGGPAGKDGVGTKTVVAVRSTAASLEVPLRHNGATIADAAYLAGLVAVANDRFAEVARRRARFDALLRERTAHLAPPPPPVPALPDAATAVFRCDRCTGAFPSRNALFKHIKSACGAAGGSGAEATLPAVERADAPSPASGSACAPSAGGGSADRATAAPATTVPASPPHARVLSDAAPPAVCAAPDSGARTSLLVPAQLPAVGAAIATPLLTCRGCSRAFPSRNALYHHLDTCALARAAVAPAAAAAAPIPAGAVAVVVTAADRTAAAAAQARSMAFLRSHVQPLLGEVGGPASPPTAAVDAAALGAHALSTGAAASVTRMLGGAIASTSAARSGDSVDGLSWRLLPAGVIGEGGGGGGAAVSRDAEGRAHSPLHRWGGAADVVGGTVVWFGGFVASGAHGRGADVLLRPLGGSCEWTHVLPVPEAPWPTARQKHTLTAIALDAAVVVGGHAGMTKPCADVWVVRIGGRESASGTGAGVSWSQQRVLGASPPPRWGHIACAVGVGAGGGAHRPVVVFGGRDAERSFGDVWIGSIATDGTDWAWQQPAIAGPRPRARYGHAAAATAAGMVVHGGFVGPHAHCDAAGLPPPVGEGAELPPTAGTPLLGDMWVLDTRAWAWRHVALTDAVGRPFALPPRMAHTMASVSARDVLIWGGACKNPQHNAAVRVTLVMGGPDADVAATAQTLLDNGAYAQAYLDSDGHQPTPSAAVSGRIPAAHLPWPLRSSAIVVPAPDTAWVWSLGGGGVAFAWGSHYNATIAAAVPAPPPTPPALDDVCLLTPLQQGQAARAALAAAGCLDPTRVAKPRHLRDCELIGSLGADAWHSFHNHLHPWLAIPILAAVATSLPSTLVAAPLVRCSLPCTLALKAERLGGDAAAQLQRASAEVQSWMVARGSAPPAAEEACRPGVPGGWPARFEWVGDIAVLPPRSLTLPPWREREGLLLAAGEALARCLGTGRIARHAAIDAGGTRASRMEMVWAAGAGRDGAFRLPGPGPAAPLPAASAWPDRADAAAGEPAESVAEARASLRRVDATAGGWVAIRDHGIVCHLDALRVMFSSGNGTEKARMGALTAARGQTIVDLFAGIGYFTLPLLVRAGARMVHACEWNPDALACLRMNLVANRVEPARYRTWAGDNRGIVTTPGCPLVGIADRVLLGLLPTGVPFLHVALRCLRRAGGVLHVHANHGEEEVASGAAQAALVALTTRLCEEEAAWRGGQSGGGGDATAAQVEVEVAVEHVERVKSYAPRVHHYVFDVRVGALPAAGLPLGSPGAGAGAS